MRGRRNEPQMGLKYRIASRLARSSGYAQDLFNEGWQVGYDDAAADLQETHPRLTTLITEPTVFDTSEVVYPDFTQGPPELGYFHGVEDSWTD